MPYALPIRSEEHTSELQSPCNLVCRLLLEKRPNTTLRLCSGTGRGLAAPAAGLSLGRVESGVFEDAVEVALGRSGAGCPLLRFFFNDTATTEIYTLSLHDALPISVACSPATGSGTAQPDPAA